MTPRTRLLTATVFISVCAAPAVASAAAPDRTKLDRPLQSLAARSAGERAVRVIIRLRDGIENGTDVVRRVNGRGGARLATINAQVADVAEASLDALAADPSVLSVHLDRPLVSQQNKLTLAPGTAAATGSTKASRSWDGTGVGVAMIDSGVMPHDDLGLRGNNNSRPRLAGFVDFVNGRPTPYDDFGHGTHVAGIIGGDGTDSAGAYAGLAPGASLLSLKVLDASGRGTISTAIQAIDYVIANRTRHNIRVINLSVGAAVTESFFTDPFTARGLARRAVGHRRGRGRRKPRARCGRGHAVRRRDGAGQRPVGAHGRRLQPHGYREP